MNYIQSLKRSATAQCTQFFYRELQKAFGTGAKQLLQWQGFDPQLLDLKTSEIVFLTRVDLPVFDLIPFEEQLEYANDAATTVILPYVGIYACIAYDEEYGIIVYFTSEEVTIEAIDALMSVDEGEPRRTASVHALELVQTPMAPVAPVEEENNTEPLTEPDSTEDSPVDTYEPFDEGQLTPESLEALDTLRKDENAVGFIRDQLSDGVAQFDAFVEFNDVSDFPMSLVYSVLQLYKEYIEPAPTAENIFGDDEPDTFFAEDEPDAFPTEDEVVERTAPLGGERTTEPVQPDEPTVDTETERVHKLLQNVADELPADSLYEIENGALTIVMTRSKEGDNGTQDVDYNLRLTVARATFADVHIDKYRLENNGALLIEAGSPRMIIDYIHNL